MKLFLDDKKREKYRTIQDRSIVSVEVVSWWMLDLARAVADDKFTSLLHHLQKCF